MLEVEAAEAGVKRARKGLTARNQRASASSSIPVIFFSFFLGFLLDVRLDDLLHISDLDQHVLRLQVRVDNAALPVEII